MRCLLVEDERPRIDAVFGQLEKLFGNGNVDIAEDRDSAVAQIVNTPYDLVVLDQRIPSGVGQLNADVIHGRAVLEQIRDTAPQTVVYFLTALPMEDDYVDELVAQGRAFDLYGARQSITLVQRFRKNKLDPFFEAVETLATIARVTDEIEINTRGGSLSLGPDEARLIRCFGRLQNGICVDVELINDGLSVARVLKADVKDDHGQVRMSAVGKLGPHQDIASEVLSYEKEIMRLPSGTYAPLLPPSQPRVLSRMAAFYRLLEGYDRSVFQVLKASDDHAAVCARELQKAEQSWSNKPTVVQQTIGALAKLLIWEDRIPAIHALLPDLNWAEYEARKISVNLCTRHGDLHGENAKVNSNLQVMMLDYGSVASLPSAIDAITLELSPFFHPHGHRELFHWWPGQGELNWFDVDVFCSSCAVPNYVKACRAWAHAEAFGNREVLACAYIYVLRQLQFKGADHDLAREMLRSIIARGLDD